MCIEVAAISCWFKELHDTFNVSGLCFSKSVTFALLPCVISVRVFPPAREMKLMPKPFNHNLSPIEKQKSTGSIVAFHSNSGLLQMWKQPQHLNMFEE